MSATMAMDAMAKAIGQLAQVGHSVSNKALTSNVATLTTSSAHDMLPGDIIYVRGCGSPFDAYFRILTVPTSTTFTFHVTNANVSSVAVSPVGMVSARLSVGRKKYPEDYDQESKIRVLSEETKAFVALWVADRTGSAELTPGRMVVLGQVMARLDRETSSDLNSLYETCEDIVQAASAESIFQTPVTGARMLSGAWSESQETLLDGIARFDLRFELQVPSC